MLVSLFGIDSSQCLLVTVLTKTCKFTRSFFSQVVYVTATAPYVFLIAILAYGCTLEGAIDGIKFFFIPDWHKLKDITVRKWAVYFVYAK